MSNRLRVLVLDDDKDRHAWVRELYPRHEVVSAYTAVEVLGLLQGEKWDILHLDHDLADRDPANATVIHDGTMVRPADGRDVARWLVAHFDRCPLRIWIHSWADEAAEMETILLPLRRFGRTTKREQAPV